MFVDASALVALLTEETEAAPFARKIDEAEHAITSPIAVYETVMALARKTRQAPSVLLADLHGFLFASGIQVAAVDEEAGDGAVEAHVRYGRGTGHPAALNMGDCFAYAMAKQHGAALLYKGDDFARTDLA